LRQLLPKPYKLFNRIQNYEWGGKDAEAFIPALIGEKPEPGLPYAELWIGAHPKAPSNIELQDGLVPLDKIVEEFTIDCLGEYVGQKFSGKFPFLLKVLSAAQALSIQAHPDKKQAEKLHALDPVNYPDDNHKPEIAIALNSLIAIAGFRPVEQIISNIRNLPEIAGLVGNIVFQNLLTNVNKREAEKSIQRLYELIMREPDESERLSVCISRINNRLNEKDTLSLEETQFLKQYKLYGSDVGLFSFFFFNIIELKSGEAIFTGAGVPHAYIKGDIIECMANSDNVVRAGLTNKFKDVDALLKILKYEFKEYEIINSEQKTDGFIYKTGAAEFEVTQFNKPAGFNSSLKSGNKPSVCLIISGELEVRWQQQGEGDSRRFLKGESFFVPACLSDYSISVDSSAEFFVVNIP